MKQSSNEIAIDKNENNNNDLLKDDESELKSSIKKLKVLLIIQIVLTPFLLIVTILMEVFYEPHINYCPQAFNCHDCDKNDMCICDYYDESNSLSTVKCYAPNYDESQGGN